jgi:hypothetical protein
MKKLVLVVSLISMTLLVHAQINFGIKAGLNYSGSRKIATDSVYRNLVSRPWAPSFHLGVTAERVINRHAFGVELLLSDKASGKNKGRDHLLYLNLPLLYSITLKNKIKVQAGCELGLLLDYYMTGKYANASGFYDRPFDLGLLTGISYKLTERYSLSARYVHGLLNTADKDPYKFLFFRYINSGDALIERPNGLKYKNQNISISLCYKLKA